MITIHQRYRQTDRQTDRQTTCDRNTALCTKVHRAVKMTGLDNYGGTRTSDVKIAGTAVICCCSKQEEYINDESL